MEFDLMSSMYSVGTKVQPKSNGKMNCFTRSSLDFRIMDFTRVV